MKALPASAIVAASFVAGASLPALLQQWRPDLLFVVSIPVLAMTATFVASLVTNGRERWILGAVVYLAIHFGLLANAFARGAPETIGLFFSLVIAGPPAVAGVLSGLAAQLIRRSNTRSRLIGLFLLIPATAVGVVIVRAATDERRGRTAVLETKLLSEAPLGSSMPDVLGLISAHGWELRHVDTERGYFHQEIRPERIEGAQHIEANAGDYCNLLCTNVAIYWGFDSAGKLSSIWIWKTTDGP